MNPDSRLFVEVEGVRLALHVFGDPAGYPLLFFHGWPCEGGQAVILDETARRHHFRILALDRPGVGLSGVQPGRRIIDWPRLVKACCERWNIQRFAILGLSGGGPYALATAHELPAMVSAVSVVCGAPHIAELANTEDLLPMYRLLHWSHRKYPHTLRWVFRLAGLFVQIPPPRWLVYALALGFPAPDQQILRTEAGREMVVRTCAHGWKFGTDGIFEDAVLYAAPWNFDPGAIKVPVSIWHGVGDMNFRWQLAQQLARSIPGSSFHLVPGEGHFSLPIRRANEILAALSMVVK